MPRGKEDGDEKAGPSAVKKEEEEASTAPLPEKVRRPLPCHTVRSSGVQGTCVRELRFDGTLPHRQGTMNLPPEGRRSALPLRGVLRACKQR